MNRYYNQDYKFSIIISAIMISLLFFLTVMLNDESDYIAALFSFSILPFVIIFSDALNVRKSVRLVKKKGQKLIGKVIDVTKGFYGNCCYMIKVECDEMAYWTYGGRTWKKPYSVGDEVTIYVLNKWVITAV